MTGTNDQAIQQQIQGKEAQIMQILGELTELRRQHPGTAVPDYTFRTMDGEVRLAQLFGDHDHLLVIHNMGQGCRYCTLWADGINGLLPHLESTISVALASLDPPQTQRRFAAARGWRFRMVSHKDSNYLQEQSVSQGNEPGAVMYQRKDGQIMRRSSTVFGPNDVYCALWPLLGLAGMGVADFTPQYRYWQPPKTLLDGGENRQD